MLYLLLVYILFLIGYLIYSVMAIYHLRRFGYVGDLTKTAIIVYLIASVVIISFSIILISTRNWPADFNLQLL